ncbi:hypothetical protein L210DRAFT_3574054 [Boletus edulis BED1]|uniref:Uncharacterized protein n=1 Tax=Boletus edulis BED1 TaxID=1328754 RepID=A0AAD4BD73_BOLED|nr:hypothetical protein L210DRAFT_3574054 [Boletus edulis BED1]
MCSGRVASTQSRCTLTSQLHDRILPRMNTTYFVPRLLWPAHRSVRARLWLASETYMYYHTTRLAVFGLQ